MPEVVGGPLEARAVVVDVEDRDGQRHVRRPTTAVHGGHVEVVEVVGLALSVSCISCQ